MTVKLFFLDMEGTIYEKRTVRLQNGDTRVHHSLWSQLMHRLGEEAVKADTRSFQKWESGEYDSYFDWVNESVRILRDHGLDQELFERSINKIRYNPGIEKTVGELHDRGIRTAIVSGGFYNHARRCQVDLGITHAFAAVDLFWDESGQLAHWNMLPSDYEGKIDFVQLLRREYGLNKRECAFVGDGKNDVHIAREVGRSFAYNAHPALRTACDHAIDSFAQLWEHLP